MNQELIDVLENKIGALVEKYNDLKEENAMLHDEIQRITFHYRLCGVKKNEIGHYVAHRLRVAGYRGDGLFSPASLRALHRGSSGIPRLINILAHKALMSAFGEGLPLAQVRHVRLARKDTEGARGVSWI